MLADSTRQLRAFLALAEQRNFTRAAAALPPVAAGVQRADPRARGSAGRAPVRPQHAQRGAHGRRPRVRGVGAPPAAPTSSSALADVRDHVARRRGRVRDRAAAVAGRRLAAGAAGARSAQHPGIELDVADVLSDACIERVRGGQADFALASAHARRDAPSCAPRCSAPTTSTSSAAPTIRWRSEPRLHADATSRPGPSSTWRATAACASTLEAALHPLAHAHGDGGRPARHRDGHGARRARHQRRAGAHAVPLPARDDRDPAAAAAGAARAGSTWCGAATAACRWRRRRCTTWWWRASARCRFSP